MGRGRRGGSDDVIWIPDSWHREEGGLVKNPAQKCPEGWNAVVIVDEGKNATSANQRLNSTNDRKCGT